MVIRIRVRFRRFTQGKCTSNTSPYLRRLCHEDGRKTANRTDLRGTVLIPYRDYFDGPSKTVSAEISVLYRLCTSFFPPRAVINAVFRRSTVVLTVFRCRIRSLTEYEGHRPSFRLWRKLLGIDRAIQLALFSLLWASLKKFFFLILNNKQCSEQNLI